MAVVGYIGKPDTKEGIIFEVTDDLIRTLNNFQWSGSARYATHNRHNTHAFTEFTGLDPDKISFDMTLSRTFGVEPMTELVKIWGFERNATAVSLVLGDKGYGKYKWNVVNHKMLAEHYDATGALLSVKVSISLVEYLNKYY